MNCFFLLLTTKTDCIVFKTVFKIKTRTLKISISESFWIPKISKSRKILSRNFLKFLPIKKAIFYLIDSFQRFEFASQFDRFRFSSVNFHRRPIFCDEQFGELVFERGRSLTSLLSFCIRELQLAFQTNQFGFDFCQFFRVFNLIFFLFFFLNKSIPPSRNVTVGHWSILISRRLKVLQKKPGTSTIFNK